jgi:hypothetical protein
MAIGGTTPRAGAFTTLTASTAIGIASGGTGQATANAAFNALAPSQTGNSGKYLTTDGTDTSWASNPLGTVTSVAASVPSFLSIAGSPITTSGTLAFSLSGTALPTTSGGTGLTSFTANGVVYASSSSALATGSNLVFDGTNLSVGTPTPAQKFHVNSASGSVYALISSGANNLYLGYNSGSTLGVIESNNSLAFNVGSSYAEALRITSSSLYTASGINVSIGTSSTPSKFTVNGNSLFGRSARLSGAAGSMEITGLGITLINDLNGSNNNWSLIQNTATGSSSNILFTSGSGTMLLDTEGNLGLGTTSPVNSANQKSITIDATTTSRIDLRSGGVARFNLQGNSTETSFVNEGLTPFVYYTNGAERARITSAGLAVTGAISATGMISTTVTNQVFDATGTSTSPRYGQIGNGAGLLTFGVEGSAGGALITGTSAYDTAFTGGSGRGIAFGQTSSTLWARLSVSGLTVNGSIYGNGGNSLGVGNSDNTNYSYFINSGATGANNANLTFNMTNKGELMRLTSDGNFGIGTNNPTSQLELNRTSTGGYSAIRFSNSGASGRSYEIGLGGSTAAAGYANNLYFYDSTAGLNRMTLDTAGNFLIGALNDNVATTNQRLLITGSPEGATLHGIFIHNNSYSAASARIALSPRYSFLYNTSPYIQAVSESTSAAALTFGTTTGGAVSERMRIQASGGLSFANTTDAGAYNTILGDRNNHFTGQRSNTLTGGATSTMLTITFSTSGAAIVRVVDCGTVVTSNYFMNVYEYFVTNYAGVVTATLKQSQIGGGSGSLITTSTGSATFSIIQTGDASLTTWHDTAVDVLAVSAGNGAHGTVTITMAASN